MGRNKGQEGSHSTEWMHITNWKKAKRTTAPKKKENEQVEINSNHCFERVKTNLRNEQKPTQNSNSKIKTKGGTKSTHRQNYRSPKKKTKVANIRKKRGSGTDKNPANMKK